jgi:cellobiose phosphorylase
MYRLLVESLLGITLDAGRLRIAPRVPASWDGFGIRYRHGTSTYAIALRRAGDEELPGIRLDGAAIESDTVSLLDDGTEHRVEVIYARH